ncbi:MAG: SusC/RagA family TonB-linked outer membrane protein [Cyclobacteriaceae bacterium]|nr:SusC/RagA family TonB-linked outer membrane protein [Cyclobacteriaceae bacterium HetDA_MAG_MS6]
MIRRFFTHSLFFLLTYLWVIGTLRAQSDVVSGKVLAEGEDEGMVGVTVVVEGTSQGAVTDIDGNYSIDISGIQDPVLIFSFIGYLEIQEPVRNRSVVDVTMKADIKELSEIVVTAFGVESEVKKINYAVQNVEGEQLQEANQSNLVNALTGKIAGVQITNSSGSAGASSTILIRGANSVDESLDNQPLFVVDGMPVDNSSAFGGGNRAMDINMDDVESISVLKGPSAAALYGIDAANGAVIITTKSGKSGAVNVDFGSTFSINQPARRPDRQESYKQGNSGIFDPESRSSWGPAFIRSDEKYDNIDNFIQNGIVQNYSVAVSGGSEKNTFYISGNYLDQTGIFPEEEYKRYGVLLKGSNKIRENLSINGSANLIHTDNIRSPVGSMFNVYRWPLNDNMAAYQNPDGSKRWLIDRAPGNEWNNPENPFWRAKNNTRTDDIDRLIGMVAANWTVFDRFKLTYRLGTDLTNQFYKSITSPESAGSAAAYQGRISESDRYVQKTTSTFLASWDRTFGGGINFSILAGNNIQIDEGRVTTVLGEVYRNPDLDNINNMERSEVTQSLSRRRIIGVFGEAKLDYKGIFNVGLTGRNDWSSTLPKSNNSFFYPSVSAGFVLSELLPTSRILEFAKLRASWATVGKDAPAHRLFPVLEAHQVIGGGFKYDFFAGNPNLKPEQTESWELGGDFRLLGGKTRVDVSYYNLKTIDAILRSRVSPASGWIILYFNAGSVENKGWEIFVESQLLTLPKFSWVASANISANNSRLIDLPSFVSAYPVTSGQVVSNAEPSSLINTPLFGVAGTKYLRNENGDIVVDENGFPRQGRYIKDEEGNYVIGEDGLRAVDFSHTFIGDREPDALIGLTNTLKYNSLSLSFLVDFRIGGDVINATKASMMGNGTAGELDDYRNRRIVFDGVVEQGSGEFVDNTEEVILGQSYFSNFAGIGENVVEDATWTRLRYVTLSYDLPQAIAGRLGLKRLSVAATGRNLLLLTKYSGGDPETNYQGAGVGGSGTLGLDYFNVPAVKGFDFSLKASF